MPSVTASESPSVWMIRERGLEKERRKVRGGNSSIGNMGAEKNWPREPLSDLSASDIDPPAARIQQSIRRAEKWIMKNDAPAVVYSQKELDNQSMVSVIGGGIKERPALDVGIWIYANNFRGRIGSSSVLGSNVDSSSYKISITQLSNCVYDKAPPGLHLDMRILHQVEKLAERTDAKAHFQRTLSSAIQRKKAEKLSMRYKIPTAEAVQLLHQSQKRKERKGLMSGGRSSGPSPKTLLETVANSSQDGPSIESISRDSVSLTASEVKICVNRAGDEMKGYSSTASSSQFSSRLSATNLLHGSLSSKKEANEKPRYKRPASTSSSSLLSSRSSAVNLGSFLDQPQSLKEEPKKQVQRLKQRGMKDTPPMDTSPYKPTAPEPIGRPLPPTSSKYVHQPKRDDHQTPTMPVIQDAETETGSKFRKARQAQPATQGRTKGEMSAKSSYVKYFQSRKYDASDAARNASRRREERRSSPANDMLFESAKARKLGETPKLTNHRSLAGGMMQEKRESSQAKASHRPRRKIFAGSLDPECSKLKDPANLRAGQSPNRRPYERDNSEANKSTLQGEEKEASQSKSSAQLRGQARGETEPEYVDPGVPEVSEATKNSRRRRTEQDSVPFNDRYRNEERKKAWALEEK